MNAPDRNAVARAAGWLLAGWVLSYLVVTLFTGGKPSAGTLRLSLFAAWCIVSIAVRSFGWLQSEGPRRWRMRFVVAILILAALELGLRGWAQGTGVTVADRAALRNYRLKPGHNYGAGLVADQHGYPIHRPPKGPVSRRIDAIGDSFAVGPNVSFDDNFLTVLQELLPGTEVRNFGVSGAGPRDYLAVLRHDVLSDPPDAVLLCFYVGNDVTDSLPRPRYFDIRQNAIYTLGGEWLDAVRLPAPEPFEGSDPQRLTAFVPSEDWLLGHESRQLQVCLTSEPVRMRECWARTESLLQELSDECSCHGIALRFMCIPDRFQLDEGVLDAASRLARVSRSDLDLDQPQRRLATWCAGHGIPFLDLRPALANRPGMFAGFDTHWSAEGNRQAALAFARWCE
jgi:hypothetical protein